MQKIHTHTEKIKTYTYLLVFIEGNRNKPEAKENDHLQEVGVTGKDSRE